MNIFVFVAAVHRLNKHVHVPVKVYLSDRVNGVVSKCLTNMIVAVCDCMLHTVWLSGLVVSALGMRTRRPRFESRVVPLFHWVATLGKSFTHIASPVSQL